MSDYLPGCIPIEQLKKLPTHRLLAYFRKYRNFLTEYEYDIVTGGCRRKEEKDHCQEECDMCKEIQDYKNKEKYWNDVRDILNTREHVSKRKKKSRN